MAAVNEPSGSGREFLLMSMNQMKFRASAKLLEDSNISIRDTGASSDMTTSARGFKNTRKGGSKDDITEAPRGGLKGKLVGNVTGTFCIKHRQGLYDATIKEMVYTPDSRFNLSSITKRLEQGYKLGGNQNAIWIEKGARKIVFDIKIKTRKGAIFAAYFKCHEVDNNEIAAITTKRKQKVNADTAHGLLGHINNVEGRKMI